MSRKLEVLNYPTTSENVVRETFQIIRPNLGISMSGPLFLSIATLRFDSAAGPLTLLSTTRESRTVVLSGINARRDPLRIHNRQYKTFLNPTFDSVLHGACVHHITLRTTRFNDVLRQVSRDPKFNTQRNAVPFLKFGGFRGFGRRGWRN
jgi:hypothetical protein